VRNACDQAAKRRQPFGFDEIALCFAGVQSCFGQLPLVPDFGKQRSENRCADRHEENAELGGPDSIVYRKTRIAEIANTKGGRPND